MNSGLLYFIKDAAFHNRNCIYASGYIGNSANTILNNTAIQLHSIFSVLWTCLDLTVAKLIVANTFHIQENGEHVQYSVSFLYCTEETTWPVLRSHKGAGFSSHFMVEQF